jgi:hypothetical protein
MAKGGSPKLEMLVLCLGKNPCIEVPVSFPGNGNGQVVFVAATPWELNMG